MKGLPWQTDDERGRPLTKTMAMARARAMTNADDAYPSFLLPVRPPFFYLDTRKFWLYALRDNVIDARSR